MSALSNGDGDPLERVQTLEAALNRATRELERLKGELSSLTYAVSHDLRAPLRAITGFSEALLEDCAAQLDQQANDYLKHIHGGAAHLELMISKLLELSQISRVDLRREPVDVSAMATAIAEELKKSDPGRNVAFIVEPGLAVTGDARLLRTMLEQLLGNAWKFTGRLERATITVGSQREDGRTIIYVRDDGAGFDPAYAGRLFGPFQRLHAATDFPGAGTGLALAKRIVNRHGGEVWATGQVGQGATVYIAFE